MFEAKSCDLFSELAGIPSLRMKSRGIVALAGLFFGAVCLEFFLTVLLAIPFVWLWNRYLIVVISIKPIGYFQGIGLLFLNSIARTSGSRVGQTKADEK